jgi:hypothetical protein
MAFHKYLAVLDRLDCQIPSASNQPQTKLDPIAATAKELQVAAHVEQIYRFNETHKLNGKAKDDPEIVSLSLLKIVAELVNIPLATAERTATTAAKDKRQPLSEKNSSSGSGDQPDDQDFQQAFPLLTRNVLKYQGFKVSNLPLDKDEHFGATGRPMCLNEITKRALRVLFLCSNKTLDRIDSTLAPVLNYTTDTTSFKNLSTIFPAAHSF